MADASGLSRRAGPNRINAPKPPKTAEMIARSIRQEIREHPLAPNDPLPSEMQLRERFAASRASVREALRLLESQQLVWIARGATGGARYLLPDISMVAEHTGIYLEAHRATQIDFHEARLTMEPSIIRFIAEHATSANILCLEESVTAQRAHMHDLEGFSRQYERFYELLAEICPNKFMSMSLLVFRSLIQTQTRLLGEVFRQQYKESSRTFEANIRAIERLLELFAKQDGSGAENWWLIHLKAQHDELKASGGANLIIKAS